MTSTTALRAWPAPAQVVVPTRCSPEAALLTTVDRRSTEATHPPRWPAARGRRGRPSARRADAVRRRSSLATASMRACPRAPDEFVAAGGELAGNSRRSAVAPVTRAYACVDRTRFLPVFASLVRHDGRDDFPEPDTIHDPGRRHPRVASPRRERRLPGRALAELWPLVLLVDLAASLLDVLSPRSTPRLRVSIPTCYQGMHASEFAETTTVRPAAPPTSSSARPRPTF